MHRRIAARTRELEAAPMRPINRHAGSRCPCEHRGAGRGWRESGDPQGGSHPPTLYSGYDWLTIRWNDQHVARDVDGSSLLRRVAMPSTRPWSRDLLVILAAVLLSAAASWWVANRGGRGAESHRQSLYADIVERGHIRAGYAVGAPYFVKDPNTGDVSGIFADVMAELAKGLGLEVRWVEEVGYGQMIEGLRAKRFDIVGSGVWINANRASGADFSSPVLFDAVGAYVRHDDHRFDADLSIANSLDIRIATIDGEMASAIAAADFPEAQTEALPQMTDFTHMILNVVTRKADLTFLGLGPARRFQAENPDSIRNVTPEKPVRIFPTAMMLPHGEHELRRAIDLALTQLVNDGAIDRIIDKYEGIPGSHYRLAPAYSPHTE